MEIPGFYYDQEKRKYFAITADSRASTSAAQQYSQSAVSAKRRKEQELVVQVAKRKRIEEGRATVPPTRVSLLRSRGLFGGNCGNHGFEQARISRLRPVSESFMEHKIMELNGNSHAIWASLDNGCIVALDTTVAIPFSSQLTSFAVRPEPFAPSTQLMIGTSLDDSTVKICRADLTSNIVNELYKEKIGITLWASDIPESDHGILAVFGGSNGRVFSLATNGKKQPIHIPGGSDCLALKFQHPDTLWTGGRDGKIWQVDLRSKNCRASPVFQCSSSVFQIQPLSTPGTLLSIGFDGKLCVWDTRWSYKSCLEMQAKSSYNSGQDFFRNKGHVKGDFVYVVGDDDRLKCWSLEKGNLVLENEEGIGCRRGSNTQSVFAKDSRVYVSGGTCLQIYS